MPVFHDVLASTGSTCVDNKFCDHLLNILLITSFLPLPGILLLLLSPLITIASYFFMTPFIKPRTFPRFFWTYLIPVVPLATSWDGIVSILRTYSPKELKELTDSCTSSGYTWEVGYASTGTPVFSFTYLVGYPVEKL